MPIRKIRRANGGKPTWQTHQSHGNKGFLSSLHQSRTRPSPRLPGQLRGRRAQKEEFTALSPSRKEEHQAERCNSRVAFSTFLVIRPHSSGTCPHHRQYQASSACSAIHSSTCTNCMVLTQGRCPETQRRRKREARALVISPLQLRQQHLLVPGSLFPS